MNQSHRDMGMAMESTVQVSRQGLHTDTGDTAMNMYSSGSSSFSDEDRDRIDQLLGVPTNMHKERTLTFEEKFKP